MGTNENLQEAFAGESQANRKYQDFARQADADGFSQVPTLFRAGAHAETVHAQAHLRVMGGVKETAENVKAAIEGEGFEFQEMYPKFLAEAESEGGQAAATSFGNALAVERIHHSLYTEASKAISAGEDLPAASIYVCEVCGNTVAVEPPEKCPICNSPREKFVLIE